jgi:hypothetical protein
MIQSIVKKNASVEADHESRPGRSRFTQASVPLVFDVGMIFWARDDWAWLDGQVGLNLELVRKSKILAGYGCGYGYGYG